jgi:hypothetical protein
MIPDSFLDEMQKLGGLPGLAKFIGGIPDVLKGIGSAAKGMGIVEKNLGAVRAVTTGIGAVSGGMYGSSQAGEGNKAKGFAIGALAGGAGGFFAGKPLATKLPALGTKSAPYLQGLSKHLATPDANISSAMKFMGRNWTPMVAPINKNIVAPTNRAMLGLSEQAATGKISRNPPGMIRAFGELGKSFTTIKTQGLRGVGTVLKDNVKEHGFYNKEIDGKTYQFKRSPLGRVIAPALMSGVGFGALEAATATDSQGNPAGVGTRVLKGGTTALAWGAAPGLMTAKALGYDIPKTLISAKKAPNIEA